MASYHEESALGDIPKMRTVDLEGTLEKGYWKSRPTSRIRSIPTRAAQWCVDHLRPAFLTGIGGHSSHQGRRTAYLDGLRGFAAFLVYWGHHELWAHDGIGAEMIFENAYGYQKKHYFVAFPGVRIFFSGGHFAVSVFFVLSGYVLSAKPLSLIRAGDYLQLGDNLASALFRRWLRLHIPVICTTFMYMTYLHLFRIHATPEIKSSYGEELWNWYVELKNFSFVFRTGGEPWFTYNFHSWSIPVEFRGSIVIYTALQAFSKCRPNARLLCELGLIFYFMYIADGWFCALFMSGMLLCDLDLRAARDELPDVFMMLEPFKEGIFYAMLCISMYLGGVPSRTWEEQFLRESPGWHYLSYLKPQAVFDFKWFYLFWAATFLVASISRIHWLKSFFETPFNQYLGRISFAFYLVHGPVLWVLGDRLYAAVGWVRDSHAITCPGWINRFPLPKVGPLGLELNFFAPHLILLPVTLWLAEIVTKFVDEPSVRFAQWFYRKTLAPANQS
ncbi:acyltransferase family-domain-containing protein [Aspergillus caelatus]|uniref:Acyltransferase family-domain-containing protein n=2 Tax=Aspergillus subgen. Circumdati TaxID=2720871 RepID=A0A5N7A6G4_9EURO|nr:acyltransferase family-domain-containing protein [Aspergillus caelatus]KAE8364120.1 acyltransferase family-domain-containing protein [Aspergillus caelatus]KAE8416452.1 acyltransferase family-domain-containing protein [Aspergillus pseudocaelatus]